MVEIASQADIGYQDELWIGPIGAGATVTEWVQVLGVETLNTPEKTPEDIDVTHMQSPGRSRETIPGLLAVADWSQEIQDWPTDPGQMLLEELGAENEAGTREDILVEFNVGGRRRTYRGYVNSFTLMSSIGEKRMNSLAMKIFERQATNPRTVA